MVHSPGYSCVVNADVAVGNTIQPIDWSKSQITFKRKVLPQPAFLSTKRNRGCFLLQHA